MRITRLALMSLAWCGVAAAQTGLEFLEPKDIAFAEVRGTVTDDATGARVEGANVLAIWQGTTYGFHGSSRHCLRIDAARTRADGSFSLVAPARSVYRSGMAQQYVDIRIHSPGMEERLDPATLDRKTKLLPDRRSALAKLGGWKELGLDADVRMVNSQEDAPDRLRRLKKLAGQPMQCETRGNTDAIRAFYEAPAKEARSLAKTRYQLAIAEALESDARLLFADALQRFEANMKIMQRVHAAPELSDLERRNHEEMTPLMEAAASGRADAVRSLLEAGASPNRTRAVNDLTGPDSALTIAMGRYANARLNKLPTQASYPAVILALLADPKTDRNLRDRSVDYTPLMKALTLGQDDVVEWLLAAGADPGLAAYSGQHTALGVALQAMNQRRDGKPLPPAARQFGLLLASKRVNLDTRFDWGLTPLIHSLTFGDTDIARQLLEAGANPNAEDKMKRTPLTATTQTAILNPQHAKFVDSLRLIAAWPGVERGALFEGKTALQMAAQAKRDDLVGILK